MVQFGILLMVVVMKINRKKVVPPIRGGLLWRVPGGTSADRYRVPRSIWILMRSEYEKEMSHQMHNLEMCNLAIFHRVALRLSVYRLQRI